MKLDAAALSALARGPTRAPPSETEARSSPSSVVGGTARAAGAFEQRLTEAVRAVDAAQHAGDEAAARATLGEGSLHEAALALEKADIELRLMAKTRDKVVQAYQELMRMSV